MIVALSDTHAREGHRLEGRTREAVDEAEFVVHAGDYVTADALDAFESVCDLRGVYGNNDPPAVRDRVPETRLLSWNGARIAVAHGHNRSEIELSMLARQSNADLLVFGHSHRPEFREGVVPLLNPGSHADPRWNRPAHAELRMRDGALVGELVDPSSGSFERFRIDL